MLTRYDPFRELLSLTGQLNRFFIDPQQQEGLAASRWPPVNVYRDSEGVTLTAELPGIDPKQVDIKVENNTLILSGERKLAREDKRDNYHRVEGFYGTFLRSFSLPTAVDVEKIKAEHRNGLLRVFIPVREECRPRQIKVQVEG